METFVGLIIAGFSAIEDIGKDGNANLKTVTLPTVTAEYLYNITAKTALGGSFSFGVPQFSTGGESDFTFMYGSLQFKVRQIYKSLGRVNLYGAIGIGAELLVGRKSGKNNLTAFIAEQITPFGVQAAFKRMTLTAELTGGSEGLLLTAGLGVKF